MNSFDLLWLCGSLLENIELEWILSMWNICSNCFVVDVFFFGCWNGNFILLIFSSTPNTVLRILFVNVLNSRISKRMECKFWLCCLIWLILWKENVNVFHIIQFFIVIYNLSMLIWGCSIIGCWGCSIDEVKYSSMKSCEAQNSLNKH